ncbi:MULTISPECIES: sodium:solute symporter [Arthrobacter]|uniref:Sodium:solute symporter family protein n=1 Tax=Arthrobacter terricola TaxID=2547396 RepID=A0A4R5KVH9_9MICC|nr:MULTISPECIES: sodium:solute symporter family protein [Arthrobacter]MBT8160321.1 sodium:solute symporter family protein [Arthrobacter sp. GN70]TDF99981.1 sodium:solute symporter family protein [Arthrobacter terricola]
MNMLIGYGAIVLFTALVVYVMSRGKRGDSTMSEYATGGRSFNSWFGTMSFLNTWLAGTVFIAFAGLTASGGVLGMYSLSYSLLSVVLMFFLGTPVNKWGRTHDLRTQADLLGLRYNSRSVRVIAAIIGVLASVPWVVLGMQSLGLVFSTLSFGQVSPYLAVVLGVLFIAARQVWTVRLGTRGLIISDMVQGLFAYGVGFLVILGLLTWLFTNGHGFGNIAPALLELPGPGSPAGPLYLFSLIFTGMMGAWCWPDLFVRMFSVRTPRTVQKSAVQAAPILFLFSAALTTMCLLASSVPGVSAAPDTVWFIMAGVGGTGLVAVAGVCVVAATMGNIGANLQAVGTQVVNDVIGVRNQHRVESSKGAKIAVAAITLVSAAAALLTANQVSGLIVIAFVSYQAVCQLAPTLLLGIFWRRGTALAANAAMVSGILVAAVLELMYPSPLSIPWLGGLTSGVAGLIVNLAVYVAVSIVKPAPAAEQERVDRLFDDLKKREPAALDNQPA